MLKTKIKNELNNSFITNQLSQNENLLFLTKESKILYFLPILYLIISIGICFIYLPIGLLSAIFSLLYFLVMYLSVNSSIYAITNKKLIVKTGFIQRQSMSLPLYRIESINLQQSIIGRIFNFGIVSINGVGGDKAKAYILDNPIEFQEYIYAAIDKNYDFKGI